ncbi:unnamed protein product [Adineta ricciae]|uniref:Uncharacterized protein n=1 Tax=Adineta ricciae TaxID=249248 RepID=A0A815AI22_ADIRI|nr:unnamed protein product [Adineta ricciae]
MTTQHVEELICSARKLYDTEEYLAARALYTQLLASDPFDARMWHHRSNAHLKLGYPELAFTDAVRGLQLLDDTLAKKTLSREDQNDAVLLRLDVLYTCLLTAEALNSFQMALQYIDRLLANVHLLSSDACKVVLEKQATLRNKISQRISTLRGANVPSGVSIDTISNLGTMHVVKYPWDVSEPFTATNDLEAELKELNSAFEPFAPKLKIVPMPDNPALYTPELTSSISFSKVDRPQLGIIARKKIKPKERILDEAGIFVNNGLYGPKCNYCNGVLSISASNSNEMHKTTCSGCGERFCSVDCLHSALETYHKVLCGRDISHILTLPISMSPNYPCYWLSPCVAQHEHSNVIYPFYVTADQTKKLTERFHSNENLRSLHLFPLPIVLNRLTAWCNDPNNQDITARANSKEHVEPRPINFGEHELWYRIAACFIFIGTHVPGGCDAFKKDTLLV